MVFLAQLAFATFDRFIETYTVRTIHIYMQFKTSVEYVMPGTVIVGCNNSQMHTFKIQILNQQFWCTGYVTSFERATLF